MATKQAWTWLAKQPIASRTATASRALRCSPAAVPPGCSPSTRSASFFPTASPLSCRAQHAYRGAVRPRLFSVSSPARAADDTGVSAGSSPPAQGEMQQDTSPPPQYELTFTCKPCGTRSAHKISKQGYHYGSVLITCPGCRNRHIISDHLGIFGTQPGQARTIEDILREKGQLVKKGTLGEDGDIEFWEDGSSSDRKARQDDEGVVMAQKKEGAEAEAEKNAAPGSTFQTATSRTQDKTE